MRTPRPRIPILTAPTAAGKTALALDVAERYGLEIVAADAFTVYRGLDIGTAKPTPAERARVPHHLLDVAEVDEDFDVARFTRLAEQALGQILGRGRLPLVVGGTGFYLSAMIRGLPQAPPADSQGRAELEAELSQRGVEALLAEIAQAKPDEVPRMERNPRRVIRALEVYRRTGKFPSEFGYSQPAFAYDVVAFTRPADELEPRIRARVREMLRAGWAQEAAWLASRVPPTRLPRPTAWQALGYREAYALALGELPWEAAEDQITLATRQYAKRQLTWLRGTLQVPILGPLEAARLLDHHLRNQEPIANNS